MFLSIVPFLYSKRTAAARSLVSLSKSERFVGPLRLYRAVELPYGTPYPLHPGGEKKRAKKRSKTHGAEKKKHARLTSSEVRLAGF
jgi:hypothetical protein